MQHICAPWRIKYLEGEKESGCIFCTKPNQGEDEKNYIIHRGAKCFAMLNLYPYNNGHLMVSPYRHTGRMEELTDEEMLEMMQIVRRSVRVLNDLLKPDGFNMGINAGEAAGAGFGDHIHMHVVPRWVQDTNFMPVIADTRVLSESLDSNYIRMVERWNSQKG